MISITEFQRWTTGLLVRFDFKGLSCCQIDNCFHHGRPPDLPSPADAEKGSDAEIPFDDILAA
jgi:hypothetical protein